LSAIVKHEKGIYNKMAKEKNGKDVLIEKKN